MSSKYSVAEARAQLPRLLDEVESGHKVELTRRGKPVAMLVSIEDYRRLTSNRMSFSKAYELHRSNFSGLSRAEIGDLRDRDAGRKVTL